MRGTKGRVKQKESWLCRGLRPVFWSLRIAGNPKGSVGDR